MGRSFKKLVLYLKTGKGGRQRERDRVDWVEFRNLPTRNPDTAACMMAATAGESVSGTREPVYHFSVSCDPDDPVDAVSLQRVADRLIHDLDLEEHQILIFAHKDRSHPHLHIVVNRVHPERHTLWRTWKDYPRIERSLRAQEQELGLRIVPGWNSVVVRSEDGGLRVPDEHETKLPRVYPRPSPRRGGPEFLREVKARAFPVLRDSQSWDALERGLAEQGLALRVKGGGIHGHGRHPLCQGVRHRGAMLALPPGEAPALVSRLSGAHGRRRDRADGFSARSPGSRHEANGISSDPDAGSRTVAGGSCPHTPVRHVAHADSWRGGPWYPPQATVRRRRARHTGSVRRLAIGRGRAARPGRGAHPPAAAAERARGPARDTGAGRVGAEGG